LLLTQSGSLDFVCCCFSLHAGASKTTLSNNTAQSSGGNLAAAGDASVHATGAFFTGGEAPKAGSIYAAGNSSITLKGCTITAAKATWDFGGCIAADTTATVRLERSVVNGCQSKYAGGGVSVGGEAELFVTDSNITGCKAEQFGGGVWAEKSASITLCNAVFRGNTAVEGGGIYLRGDATLQLVGTSLFQNNNATSIGGGLALDSSGFKPSELSTLRFSGNKAPNGFNTNITFIAQAIAVDDAGNAASYIPSANGGEGLYFTLNVSGPHGLPSESEVRLALLEKGSNNQVFSESSWGDSEGPLREVNISPQALTGNCAAGGSIKCCHVWWVVATRQALSQQTLLRNQAFACIFVLAVSICIKDTHNRLTLCWIAAFSVLHNRPVHSGGIHFNLE
jgi:hypothetical protein